MLDCARVTRRKLLWLLVPALALGELAAHAYFSKRAPTIDEWRAVRPAVAELRKTGELVVAAPEWGTPLARHALGDELMPLAHVSRPDASSFARAIEISSMGHRAPELEGWRQVDERRQGDFVLRVLENPKPAKVTFDFVDRIGPETLSVTEGAMPCPWNQNARAASGGLGGHPTFPAQRFECPSGLPRFVGVTVIDDEDYRPRRCVWAHPSAAGPVTLRFSRVPLGDRIQGYTGMAWVLARDGVGGTVELELRAGGESLGRAIHPDVSAWVPFQISLGRHAGTTADVELVVQTDAAQNRPFCFYADSRWGAPPG